MSEVDRLSNSGLYPMLPIADKRPSRDGSGAPPRGDKQAPDKSPQAGDTTEPASSPRPPKSLIDEYA
ncbi:MAG: hypothetical protein ABJD53_06445 [Gammaproteobacteria bacterium]